MKSKILGLLGIIPTEEEQRILDKIKASQYTSMKVVGRGTLTMEAYEVASSAAFKKRTEQARQIVNSMNRKNKKQVA